MDAHPATQLFPMMDDAEIQALVEDIKARGLIVPILTYKGQILDGRNRLRACELAGVAPRTEDWQGNGSPTAWVISLNLRRRHLTPSQKAAVAVDALPLLEDEARRRQIVLAGTRHSDAALEPLPFTDLVAEIPQGQGRSRDQAAKMFGVSPRYVSEAKHLKECAPDLYQDVREGRATITEAKREEKERQREEVREHNRELVKSTPALTIPTEANRRYQTIILDPPWDWDDEGDTDQYGRARPTYATMPIDNIAALPIPDLAEPNAHIYLWITNRSLPKGFVLLERWGFRYITTITWIKPSIGMGNYFRGSTEHVLFGVCGSLPLLRRDVGTHFTAPRPGEHSAKPDAFYALVESCSPGPWLEMFSRKRRPGWSAWGAEVSQLPRTTTSRSD